MKLRVVALGVAVSGVSVLLGGCGYGGSLAQREVVVMFKPGATQAEHVAARDACSGYPNASPEPIIPSKFQSTQVNNVRFRVDKASDAQLSALYNCLRKQRGVIGVNIPDTTEY